MLSTAAKFLKDQEWHVDLDKNGKALSELMTTSLAQIEEENRAAGIHIVGGSGGGEM